MVDNLGMWGRGSGVGVLSKRKMRQKMLSGIPVLFPKDKNGDQSEKKYF